MGQSNLVTQDTPAAELGRGFRSLSPARTCPTILRLLVCLSATLWLLRQQVETHNAPSSVSCLSPSYQSRGGAERGFQKSHLLVFKKTLSASHHSVFAVSAMCLRSLRCLCEQSAWCLSLPGLWVAAGGGLQMEYLSKSEAI